MQDYTDKQISEMYNNLPQDLKKAIFSVEMTGTIKRIGQKYQLQIDKIGILGNETGMVMIGVTHPNDFIPNLSQRLSVSKEIAEKIADEVNMQIFAKVRESMKKIHGVNGKGAVEKAVEEKKEERPVGQSPLGGVPEIIKGVNEPPKYPSGDPYHEPIG